MIDPGYPWTFKAKRRFPYRLKRRFMRWLGNKVLDEMLYLHLNFWFPQLHPQSRTGIYKRCVRFYNAWTGQVSQ